MAPRNIRIKGIAEFEKKLGSVGQRAPGVAKASLYDGAAVVADAYKNALNSIQTEPFFYAHHGWQRLPSPEEKAAVMSGTYGIAKMQMSGFKVNTIIGAKPDAGYVTLLGKKTPTALILRSIEHGTSFMKKQPVLRRAINAAKGETLGAMSATAEDRIKKLIND